MALFLITRGADVNFKRSRDGLAALHYTAIEWNDDLAEILIEHGANPNIQNNGAYAPLFHAIANCDARTMSMLLEHGADPDLENKRGGTQRDRLAQCDIRESWDPTLAGLSALYEK